MRIGKIQPDYQKTEGTVNQKDCLAPQKTLNQTEPSSPPFEKEKLQEDQSGEKNALQALTERVNQLNETLRVFDKKLHFDIHEETNRVMVQVIDVETDEVLREIPPERILDMVANIEETIGLIIDERI